MDVDVVLLLIVMFSREEGIKRKQKKRIMVEAL